MSPLISRKGRLTLHEHVVNRSGFDHLHKLLYSRAIASKFMNDGDKPYHTDEPFQRSTCKRALQAEPKIRCDCPVLYSLYIDGIN